MADVIPLKVIPTADPDVVKGAEMTTGDLIAAEYLPATTTAQQYVPICLADGSTLNLIPLTDNYVPVLLADGQTNQIKMQ